MLDHLVLAVPDLARSVQSFTQRTGVAPAPGGSHPGLGTANFLVGLGGQSYLEIIGPDPDQPEPDQPRPFRIDAVGEPRIVTWAMRSTDLDAQIARARHGGFDPGDARAMSRRTPAGDLLAWRLTMPRLDLGGLVPFLIDWGDTPHPASRGLPELPLLEWHASHPDPGSVRPALAALGAELQVEAADRAGLTAVIEGRHGPVRL
jgi:hypothetical protein